MITALCYLYLLSLWGFKYGTSGFSFLFVVHQTFELPGERFREQAFFIICCFKNFCGVNVLNVFKDSQVAQRYDWYYQTSLGASVDRIEKALILEFLNQIHSREMLELGCGTGHWTHFFCEEGFQVTGVDESEAMLEQARLKDIAGARFLQADASNLPFPDQYFPVISAITLFEFVDHPNPVFDEIERLLKPGGYLLCGWLNGRSELGKKKDDHNTYRHARFYTPAEVRQFLGRFGRPQLSYGVYYAPDFELLDGTEFQSSVEPSFIASLVQKI